MTREYRVLFLGGSTVDFTDTTAEESLFALTLAELQRRAPDVDWRADKESLFFAPNVTQRAAAACERYKPDVVFLCLPTFSFLHDSVANSLEGSPSLQRAARRLTATLKRLAGGGFEGATSIRGLIFRAPRSLVHRFLPPKPLLDRDQALYDTINVLDKLIEGDGPAVVCHLSVPTAPTVAATTRRYRDVLDRHNQALVRYCDAHSILHYDLARLLAEAGQELATMPDFLHLGLSTRRFESQVLSGLLLQALQIAPSSAATLS